MREPQAQHDGDESDTRERRDMLSEHDGAEGHRGQRAQREEDRHLRRRRVVERP